MICMERPKTHAAFPCGHQILCNVCAEKQGNKAPCPGCRQPVMGWAPIRKM